MKTNELNSTERHSNLEKLGDLLGIQTPRLDRDQLVNIYKQLGKSSKITSNFKDFFKVNGLWDTSSAYTAPKFTPEVTHYIFNYAMSDPEKDFLRVALPHLYSTGNLDIVIPTSDETDKTAKDSKTPDEPTKVEPVKDIESSESSEDVIDQDDTPEE